MPSQNKERIGAERVRSPERFVRNLLGGLSGKGPVQDALAMLRHLREREKSKSTPPDTVKACGRRVMPTHQGPNRPPKKRAGSGEPALSWGGCLLRRGHCCDGLQAEGGDLGTDHFARDDQLDAAILLTARGCIV